MQRDRDLPGLFEQTRRHVAAGEQACRDDPRLDNGEPDADADHSAGVSDRAADLGQCERRVQERPPFGNGLVDQREDEPVDDVARDRFAGRERAPQVGAGVVDGGEAGPVAGAGQLDGGGGEPLPCRAGGPRGQPRIHRAQPAGVAHQDERDGIGGGGGSRGPQNPGDLVEGELALDDLVVESSFTGELHGRAFRECSSDGAPGRPIARP
ncbi:hypothetical protein [Microbacterium elymi]|uniref:Uncharacterized protein n=1 Tax=Microbacterium elymi TaxID=2909587 RepID=A0ABY5NML4_9MICO|nr:hypothetical protein [Microbacterium elymi]UUT36385.1 hypothetical protein L2X98_26005 [Microbacterium elymi]